MKQSVSTQMAPILQAQFTTKSLMYVEVQDELLLIADDAFC